MEAIAKHINKMKGQRKVQAFEAWKRCMVGFRPSPFLSIRFYYHGEEFIIGNPRDRYIVLFDGTRSYSIILDRKVLILIFIGYTSGTTSASWWLEPS